MSKEIRIFSVWAVLLVLFSPVAPTPACALPEREKMPIEGMKGNGQEDLSPLEEMRRRIFGSSEDSALQDAGQSAPAARQENGKNSSPVQAGAQDGAQGKAPAGSLPERFFRGSLFGSAFFGYPFTGLRLLDIVLIALCISILLRNFRKKSLPQAKQTPQPDDLPNDPAGRIPRRNTTRVEDLSPWKYGTRDGESEAENNAAGRRPMPPTPPDVRDPHAGTFSGQRDGQEETPMRWRARSTWDALRTRDPDEARRPSAHAGKDAADGERGQARDIPQRREDPLSAYIRAGSGIAENAHIPADFDVGDFLDGARVFYSRLQTSWAARDVDDLAPFITAEMLEMLRRQAILDPEPGNVEILRVTATLTDVQRTGAVEEADVLFAASMYFGQDRANGAGPSASGNAPAGVSGPIDVRELWHFTRDSATDGSWRLAGIDPA